MDRKLEEVFAVEDICRRGDGRKGRSGQAELSVQRLLLVLLVGVVI